MRGKLGRPERHNRKAAEKNRFVICIRKTADKAKKKRNSTKGGETPAQASLGGVHEPQSRWKTRGFLSQTNERGFGGAPEASLTRMGARGTNDAARVGLRTGKCEKSGCGGSKKKY